jgi:nicotinate-nucleotide adenylyltransferase
MRIALFGGSFDPPHKGHIAIAKAAADEYSLDRVLFAPVAHQPLKTDAAAAPFADRVAMVELACKVDPRFFASEVDAPRLDGGPNYTVYTLRVLHDRMPQAELFNLVGADSFLKLREWFDPEGLLEVAEWIVVSRPGYSLDDIAALGLTRTQRKRVHLLETVEEDISATELRERLEIGDSCVDLLAPSVAAYVEAHQLYR